MNILSYYTVTFFYRSNNKEYTHHKQIGTFSKEKALRYAVKYLHSNTSVADFILENMVGWSCSKGNIKHCIMQHKGTIFDMLLEGGNEE